MNKTICLLAIGTISLGILAGCGGGEEEISKEKDAEIRNNFSRSLTPDEVKMMGASKEGGGGVKPPEKKADGN